MRNWFDFSRPTSGQRSINFNLHDALIGNDSFPLEPFDSIHVFGRYEIDAPMVSIEGRGSSSRYISDV